MIETTRLLIQPFTSTLAQAFYELTQDEGFNLFPINNYRQKDVSSALEWIAHTRLQNEQSGLGKWAVLDKSSGELLGMGGLTPWSFEGEEMFDITYRLKFSTWGKGLGMELARALVDYGFRVKGLKEITATITPDNETSKILANKLGMVFDRQILLLNVPTELYRLKK